MQRPGWLSPTKMQNVVCELCVQRVYDFYACQSRLESERIYALTFPKNVNEHTVGIRDVSGFVRLFLILTKNRFLTEMYDKFMENAILLAKNQEYVSRKCKKSY